MLKLYETREAPFHREAQLNVSVDTAETYHSIEVRNSDEWNIIMISTDQLKLLSGYLVGKLAELR